MRMVRRRKAVETTNTAYWELPDGTRSIEITHMPCISCSGCGMSYQEEEIIEEVETQLLLVDTKNLMNPFGMMSY